MSHALFVTGACNAAGIANYVRVASDDTREHEVLIIVHRPNGHEDTIASQNLRRVR